ncbi:MAG: helix-turn-helix domain-containing protein [Pseudomonadota bacterium]|nr:helix-turn-helix domain-containing protein [Pseudomonadota bacterium]
MNQSTALTILKAGQNVFLTGSAGAGKTYTLNQYIHYLKARKVPVAITASTGIAATHMNGMTIHTWAGIGIRDQLDAGDLARMYERKYMREHLDKVKVLIIDEISMLHAKQLDVVNQVLKYFKGNELAFGGIQVIVAGDFFQLPPVGKPSETNREKFAFMSAAWLEAKFEICYLTEQHRQNDSRLNDILNEIRAEQVSEDSIQQLLHTQHQPLEDNITRLFTHNIDVDQINQRHLAALDQPAKTFAAKTKGNEKILMTLTGSVRAPEQLVLKVGAKVMFVKNNFEAGYSNGTLGEVVGFLQDDEFGVLPRVRLRDGEQLVVLPESWSVENESGKALATYQQFPLCLAWAMTVHKSQGMTLQAAEIDLRQTFEKGQGYVALSRLQSLEGLRLLGLNDTALQLDRLAIKADQRFRVLAQQTAEVWQAKDAKALQQIQDQFVQQSGGTLNAAEIAKYEKRLHKKTKTSVSTPEPHTLAQTKVLFEQGLEIEEIAQIRELTQATIINHLAKLSEQDAAFDITRIRPSDELLAPIRKVYQQLLQEKRPEHFNDDGSIRLRPIVDSMQRHVGYNDVRLALAFVSRES